MSEQERPRTEAGPADVLRRAMLAEYPFTGRFQTAQLLDEALEAARTEGRQQAVREIRDHNDYDKMPVRLRAHIDRVAGLNASESPPTHYIGDDCTEDDLEHTEWFERDDGPRGIGDGEVFDSETFMAGARASRNNRAEIERGDASESGQPPEASDE